MKKRISLSVFATFLCLSAIAQSITSNSPLCTDNSSNLELKASGGSTYVWSGPNKFTSNQQNPVIVKPTPLNSGIYTCVIDGKITLNISVKVGDIINPYILRDFVNGNYILDKEICSKGGSTVLISNYSNGSPFFDSQVTRQWYKDGIALQASSNNQPNYTATEAGKYQVKIKTAQCEALSDPVTVRNVEKVKPQYYFTVSGSQLVGQSTVKLCNEYSGSVEITGAISVSGDKRLYKNGNLLNNNLSNQFSYVVTKQPGTYVLETTQGQCKSSDTLRFDYGKTTDVLVRKVDYISCNNPTFYYTINSQVTLDNNITWTKDGVLVSSVNTVLPSGSGIYQAKYENVATGCKGESEKVKVVVPSTFTSDYIKIASHPTKKVTICKNSANAKILSLNWSFSTGGTWKRDGKVHDAGNSSYQTKITQGGKYWYEYNNGQCITYSDTIEAVEEELPKITLTQTCLKDNTVKLNVNSVAGAKYNWYQNSGVTAGKDTTITVTQLGKYTVEVFRNECYSTSNDLNIGVFVPEITNICNGDSLRLKALSDGSATYSWTGPNNFKSNLQNPIITKATKNNQGIYKLSATDKGGCTFVTQTQAFVNDYPAFTLPKTFTACAGTDFEFTNIYPPSLTDSTETIGSFYVISPSQNISNQSPYLNNVSAKDAGIYNFVIYPSQGYCFAKATTQLIVDASASCKNIVVDNTISSNKCADSPLTIPFKTTGNFNTGATFKAFYEQLVTTTEGTKTQKIIVGSGQKSPILVDSKKLSLGYSYFIKVEAEDGTVSKGRYFLAKYPDYNAIVEAQSYNRFNDCSSLSLKLNNTVRFGTKLQWFLEGDTLKNANTLNFTATKSGTYSVKTLDTSGCMATFSQKISIGKLDKPIINSYSSVYGKDLNVSEIGCFSGDLSLGTNYYSNVKYTWKRNGVPQTSNYTGILTKLGGKYTVEIEQASCKAVSDTFTVTVNPNKKVSLIASQYGTDTLNAYISVTGLNTTNNNIYQIFKENKLFAEGTNGAIYVKESGKYFYKVVDGDCEAISNVLDVKFIAPFSSGAKMFLNGKFNSIAEVCDSISTKSITGTSPYAYSTKQVAKRKYTATRNGVVLPTFTTDDGIYTNAKLVNYNQYFYLYFTKLGKYKVVEEVTFVDSTKAVARFDSIVVSLGSPIKLGSQITSNVVSCNDSLFIYGENGYLNQRPVAYTWKKDGVVFKKTAAVNNGNVLVTKTSGLYVLETTYKGGCTAISSPQKVEIGVIKILTDTSAKILCDGAILPLRINTLLGTLSDTTKIYTQWQKDGKDYIKSTDNNPYNTITAKESGVYTVKIQQGKCQGISPAIIVKSDKIPNSINISDSTQFCKGNVLTLKTNDESTLSYLWERNGSFMVDATKATLDTKQDGTYRALNRRGSCWNYTPSAKAKLLENILPTAILTGDKEINYADTARVSIALTSYSPWTFKLSDGKEYTATKSPFTVSLKPQFSTNYTLTGVKNVCGTGTISGTANIIVLILSSELEEGINLNVFPIPSREDVSIQLVLDKPETMEWTLNNTIGSILGSELQANKSTRHESNISLKLLPEGVYFLRIQVGEKSLIRKIIKSN